jgi:F0F1-type ATP synthase assembly protein I
MPKKRNRYLELMGIAAQMGATIFLGAYLGKWLDARYPSQKQWYTITCTLAAVALSLYVVLKQVNKINNEDDHQV